MKIKYLLIFLILSIPIVYATNILEIDLLTKTFGEDKEFLCRNLPCLYGHLP